MISNLVYYQTNYFLTTLWIFLTVVIIYPQKMAMGLMPIGVTIRIFFYLQTHNNEVKLLKEKYPKIVFGLIGICTCAICYGIGSVMAILMGVGLPVLFSILHASLRLRNVKNKLVNSSEALGSAKSTPMSMILKEINVESEIYHFVAF